jgi:hypothetical protein
METIIVSTEKNGDKAECRFTEADHGFECQGKFYTVLFSQGQIHVYKQLLATISVHFKVIDQILIRFSCFDRYWRKTTGRPTVGQDINCLQTSRQPIFRLGRKYCTVFSLGIADPWQITVAARSMAWTVFTPSNAGIVGSNPSQDMDVCIVCVILCLCCSVCS